MADLEFHRALEKMINDEYKDKAEQLLAGGAAHYPEYRYKCGYLAALREVNVMCKDVASKIYGG